VPVDRWIARLFRLDDAGWARHANPWSVWTRVASGPLLILALWSHVWLGWSALAPVALVLLWIWINPRAFPRPASTDTWSARATFGERLWLNRDRRPVPRRHRVVPHVLSGIAGVGGLVAIGGALSAAVWPTLLGTALMMLGKLWFCDRMVWLWEDAGGAASRRAPGDADDPA
jgi:hypothetical protein